MSMNPVAVISERAARNSGMRTLRENGINYVLNGTTSVEEMLKASYE